MLVNPFLTPPQVESPQSRSWAMGFAFGFEGPEQSTMTPADINPGDADAFDQGVLAGQDAAINGLSLATPCADLHAEGPTGPHLAATEGLEGGVFLYSLVAAHFAAAVAESVLLVVTLSIALETFVDDPDVALAERAEALKGRLEEVGIAAPMELFIGGAVDTAQQGCELMVTPIFRSQQAATDAARATGRPQWLVVSWRTDQSGGVKVVDFVS
jgi:hypothetical protein